jgi:BioD-like phosphotransacetylase family protein
MKSIYIMSIEPNSGKTACCLVIGKILQSKGLKTGYFKPISTQPWYDGKHLADEDAGFVKDVLNLPQSSWDLSSLVITSDFLKAYLEHEDNQEILDRINAACSDKTGDYDVMVVEGGASLREGYLIGLPAQVFAERYDCRILAIVRYHNDIQLLDDALMAQARLTPALVGLIINRAPKESLAFLRQRVIPFLENKGIPVLGILPEKRGLAALTVGDIVDQLDAQVLTKSMDPEALVENLTVGAMTAEAALSRFRKQLNKAVITGGDRTDIQLAALETSTTCLILSGNLHPSPLIVKQAEEFGVTILLVPFNTMETIEMIEKAFGKSRLRQPQKLSEFEALVKENLDISRLFTTMGIQ